MQSDTPQGDPRLRRAHSGPKIATGFVDPCLVYIEVFGVDDKPQVWVCFATASREISEPGKAAGLVMDDAIVLCCIPHRHSSAKGCKLVLVEEKQLTLENGLLIGLTPPSYSLPPKLFRPPVSVLKQSIHYLDRKTATALWKRFESARSPNFPLVELAKRVVGFAKLDWPSIKHLIYVAEVESRRSRPSFVRRLVSSLFKKNPQPVHA